MGGPSAYTLRSREQIAAFARKLARAPAERAENAVAARVIDLWDARRARGAEPLFHPTIGAALRASRPTLQFYCPGCQVVGDIDLRRLDWHPDTDHQPDPVCVAPTLLAASAVREADRAALMPLFWVKDHPFG